MTSNTGRGLARFFLARISGMVIPSFLRRVSLMMRCSKKSQSVQLFPN